MESNDSTHLSVNLVKLRFVAISGVHRIYGFCRFPFLLENNYGKNSQIIYHKDEDEFIQTSLKEHFSEEIAERLFRTAFGKECK